MILRGGSEAARTNAAIYEAISAALPLTKLPLQAVQFVRTTDRAAVGHMLDGLSGAIDLIIPRGGKGLVARVQDEARVPVLAHLEGLCHVYVHAKADPSKARAIVLNAKMRRTGVCGAAETLLIDRAVLNDLGVLRFCETCAKRAVKFTATKPSARTFPMRCQQPKLTGAPSISTRPLR
ncbi:MAG: hypothetical protein WDM89_10135 [Rhizomicrobium sp.]